MNKKSILTGLALAVTFGVGIFAINYGINQLVNNQRIYQGSKLEEIKVAEGFFGYTSYSKRSWKGINSTENVAEEVSKGGMLETTKTYRDEDSFDSVHDGKVDGISIFKSHNTFFLKRKNDYEANKEEFDEGDKVLAETRERFASEFDPKILIDTN